MPIDPFAADRVEVVRGPATLRYGSQAIGGVVSARTTASPSSSRRAASPPRSRAADLGRRAAPTAPSRSRPAPAISPSMPMPSGAMPTTTTRRRAGSSTPSSTARAPRSAPRSSARDGFIGVSFTRFDSLYGIPGEEARRGRRPRIDMKQDKVQSRGEWRVRDFGIEAIRFWFGASDYAHNELGTIPTGDAELGSRFTNKEHEGRVEVQHLPVRTGTRRAARRRRHAGRPPQDARPELRGRLVCSSRHTPTASPASCSRSCRSRDSCACRRPPASSSTTVDGIGLVDVDRSADAPSRSAGERSFTPISASARPALRAADGRRRAPHRAVRRARAGRRRAVLQGRARGDRHLRDRQSEPRQGEGAHRRVRLQEARRARSASTPRPTTPGSTASSSSSCTGDTCDDALGDLRRCGAGDRARPGPVPAARRAPSTASSWPPSTTSAASGAACGASTASTTSCAPRFEDGDGNVPRIPPHRLGAGIYYRDANWFARVGLLHAFDQDEIGDDETPTDGLHAGQCRAELHYHGGTACRHGPSDDRPQGREPARRRRAQPRLVQEGRGAAAGRTVRAFGIIKLN